MNRKIITTADGSKTIHIKEWNEQYHSKHGAIQEANHVFIKHGLHHFYSEQCRLESFDCAQYKLRRKVVSASTKNISILEIGFGTGLNAFITCLEAEKLKTQFDYVGVEAYPVSSEEIAALNYAELISKEHEFIFNKLHEVSWQEKHSLSDYFSFTKSKHFFEDIKDIETYNLIYFDAFGARVQPELWTENIFKIMYKALKPKGVLVTYSAKGSVRRAMQSVGFTVERLEGPPGKREMLRARKVSEHLGHKIFDFMTQMLRVTKL